MQLQFNLHYNTTHGQDIVLLYTKTTAGKTTAEQLLPLTYLVDGLWQGQLEKLAKTTVLNYRYALMQNGRVVQEEFGERPLSWSKEKAKTLVIKDQWRPNGRGDNSLFTSAFTDVIFNQENDKNPPQVATAANVSFRLRLPRVTGNQMVALLGSGTELQNWQREKALPMQYLGNANWGIDLKLNNAGKRVYKYGILDKTSAELLFLEQGKDRILDLNQLPKSGEKLVVQDENFAHPAGDWRGTGMAIPVFSIRTKNSLGIGEFTDINAFVDWTAALGMDLVQILPVNDTNSLNGWIDSYPYKAISVFGLHPMYLNLNSIEGFKKAVDQKEFTTERERLNAKSVVDYEAVLGLKMQWAREIFEQQKTRFLQQKAVKDFIEENDHWLKPYAAFCYLRDKYQTPEFEKWKTYSKFSKAGLEKLTDPKAKHFDEIAFNYFLQYYLDKQLVEAREYARSKNIVLKGDIPIGIHRHSADAWVEPELYNMDGQAGAPPDPFSDDGQNWGFPTYQWEVMAQDGYQWWKNRFTQLSRYFDAFRIDHILGFFRIWQIPMHAVVGTLGYFNKAIPIQRNEFAERDIWFDYDRMCRPYVREHLLRQYFGEQVAVVRETFFDSSAWEVYQFKPEFDTQRKIETWMQQYPQHQHLQKGLFDLHGNVLFIEHAGSNGEYFHPRIEMQKISSFQELDEATRRKVDALYNNYFYERQDDFWRSQAMEKLPAMKAATNMLICGEDLGMVPEVVPGVMEELEILTLEIQRMSKNPRTKFVQPTDIPYLSVASPSTHDMEPLRLWWEDLKDADKRLFFNQELGIVGEPPYFLEPWLAELIIKKHLHWHAMWVIFPFQDLLAIDGKLRRENPADERINVPANPKHYWQYRMHLSVEELLEEEKLNRRVRELVVQSGR